MKTNDEIIEDIITDINEGGLYNHVKVSNAIDTVLDDIKDLTCYEAYKVIQSIYRAMIIELWHGKEVE